MKKVLSMIQKLGKAFMLPVAVLPIAGLLWRFGKPDLLNIAILERAGDVLFMNLPILFAIGISVGVSKDSNGSAGLAGAVSFFVMNAAAQASAFAMSTGSIFGQLPKDAPRVNIAHFGGIVAGVIAGLCYNKFHDTKLPGWLEFFGGKRFVPIVTGGISILVGSIFGVIWPMFEKGINNAAIWIAQSYGIGAFVYGVLNRLLIMFGLHHVVNTFIWFSCGTYVDADGVQHMGEIPRFFAGDPSAGGLTSGFFPIMMFALPAAVLAMYVCAKKKNKKMVGSMLLSVAFTSFLTGITSPVEYLFIFCAPVLFGVHAVLTGVSVAVCQMLGVKESFMVSAGCIDYILNFAQGTNSWLIIPIGCAMFVIYFVSFVFIIKKFDIQTPGRSDDMLADGENGTKTKEEKKEEVTA